MRLRVNTLLLAFFGAGFVSLAVHADSGETTTDRRAMVSSSPKYPTKARNERIEGDVTVCYTIDARGKVRRPYVKKTSDRVFNRAAVRAAKAIIYEAAAPGASNDRAPACSTYRFRLQPDSASDAG